MMLRNLLLLFVFFITCFGNLILATENPGFLSIDCGVEDEYWDEPTGFWFKSDKEFISTGENHEILPGYYSDNEQFGKRYKTLRSFPNGMKNCYTLQLQHAKNNSFLIRAYFSYGNYDRKNQPPTFDLYLGVNYWDTVGFNFLPTFFYDIIHVFPADTEDVCLVNTGSGTPFISSLEIRPSNVSIYGDASSSELIFVTRRDLGSDAGQLIGVRYKNDTYDRIWYPYKLPNSVPIKTSSDFDTRGGGSSYKLPVEVLRTAVLPSHGSNSLTDSFMLSMVSNEYNVYFHFAELEDFEDKLREISITVNGGITQGPFTLQYLKPLSISFQKLRIEGNFTFTIASTNESGLPPILNALEIYRLRKFRGSATDSSDVDAIMSIKHAYNINKDDWQGDPCLPEGTSWSGLNCSSNSTPRIISLNLSSSKLTGEIFPSLAHLQEIESIDLSYNELTGSVPEVLASLPKLKVLNLSGNNLKGPVPQSLTDKANNGPLFLSFIEDQSSCQRDHCEGNSKKFIVPLVVSITAAGALVVFLSVLIIFHRIKRRKQTEAANTTASNKEGLLKSKNRPFTYSEIARITANFQTRIGEGGFGKVFIGHLNDDTPVAVKLLSSSSKQGYKEFQAEAQSLMIVHHKNLVSLIGYCKEDDHMALVYEFMVNGNLRQHLSGTNRTVLNWKQRLQIGVDVAQGLDYLHNGCKPPIVHRDLKPANILLTENMQAKIADFGLSRIFSTETASHVLTSCPAGTLGYLDPEFHALGNLNKKIDVYSFGIILFELITGQPVIINSAECSTHILEWVRPIIQEGDIRMIVDPRLENEFDVNAAWKAVEIAMSCALQTSKQRPDISHVLAELKQCLGRNDQSVLTETTSFEMDSDMLPVAR
ncbi:hypothetical protein like AT4G29990 [Hibiscus trionum]|uniref:non-specific serine/threonine protein kinase n=1 Tax=Hibiscus trionum TaxID=183268 RepID=A0A9W7HIU3_HIBTR|nr:hypothetical protein like AT4G29990 [Hibiscus trionum]